jgi:predicted component of type VI protein secretion system
MNIKDWTRALRALHASAESFAVLFGKSDPRVAAVLKLYVKAREEKHSVTLAAAAVVSTEYSEPVAAQDDSFRVASEKQSMVLQSPVSDVQQDRRDSTGISAITEVEYHIHNAQRGHDTSHHSPTRSIDVHRPESMHPSAHAAEPMS